MTGRFAVSKAGHDKGKLYVIADSDERYVYLVDGEYKKTDSPKKKSIRHIQIMNETVEKELLDALKIGKLYIDEAVKYAIKQKKKSMNAEE